MDAAPENDFEGSPWRGPGREGSIAFRFGPGVYLFKDEAKARCSTWARPPRFGTGLVRTSFASVDLGPRKQPMLDLDPLTST